MTDSTSTDPPRATALVAAAALGVALSGALGWVVLYSGLPVWLALVIATALTTGCAVLLGVQIGSRSRALAWTPALVQLTWPPLWLIVVLIRYWLTGQSIGS